MGQSKKMSSLEVIISTAIGYVVAMYLYMVVLPMYGHKINIEQSFQVTAIFAAASIVRAYIVRRVFDLINKWINK